jgi:transposase
MTPIEIRNSVITLHQQGTSLREMSRLLGLSRNTVRRILREPAVATARVAALDEATQQRLKAVYERAKGNAVRMGQILAAEYDQWLAYSTLTRWVRQAELRRPPKRSGEYHFAPGQEMQHDTSAHRLEVAGKPLVAQCAGLTLAYSRRLFIQYYPTFKRFDAKHFLLRAAQFMDGTASRCVIDNTSVILAGGAGPDAVIAPEMAAFARCLGFEFLAHRINDPNRKGRIEKPFAWVEGNFLPAQRVCWRVKDGPPEWVGTDIEFHLSRQDDHTIVMFAHRKWREEVEFMAHCSTKWATFLLSLRDFAESGKGQPSPNDLKIGNWH